jgi:hypothetical protein
LTRQKIANDYSLLTADVLPESWAFGRVGLCFAEIKNGTTAAQNTQGKGYPVTRIESIQNFRFDVNRLRHTENLDAENLAVFRYQLGDIALSHIIRPWVTRNGVRIYPKNARFFAFWVKD